MEFGFGLEVESVLSSTNSLVPIGQPSASIEKVFHVALSGLRVVHEHHSHRRYLIKQFKKKSFSCFDQRELPEFHKQLTISVQYNIYNKRLYSSVHLQKMQSVRSVILDRPKALNALNLEMVRIITPQLKVFLN
jgi:hypothetical protein